MTTDSRFILAPELQENFISKYDGLPMAGGYLFFSDDLNRTTPKAVYMQSGSPPDYTYIELPNPVRLGTSGSPVDNDGNSILIFYFPFQGTPNGSDGTVREYYVEVFDSGMRPEFTRAGFPPNVSQTTPDITTSNVTNLITNGAFYFNAEDTGLLLAGETSLAPGSSAETEGYIQSGDILIDKSNNSAIDSVTFELFSLGNSPITNTAPAEYYLRYNCTNVPSAETFKQIVFILGEGVNNLNGQTATFSLWARSSLQNTLSATFRQTFGTGGSSPVIFTMIPSFSLTEDFVRYSVVFTIPSTAGKTIGALPEDFLSIILNLEMNAFNQTDIAQVQLVLGSKPDLDYIFESKQQVYGKVFSPRTGEIKIGLTNTPGIGWIPMNDGTIGSALSNATTRAAQNTWPLYNLIYRSVDEAWAPIYTSSGVLSTRTGNASADFSNNKQLALTKQLGRALSGANPEGSNLLNVLFTANYAVSHFILTVQNYDTSSMYLGRRIKVISATGGILPSGLSSATNYFQVPLSPTTFALSTTLDNAYNGVYVDIGSSGTPPNLAYIAMNTSELGEFNGDNQHRMTPPEIVDHIHATSNLSLDGGVSNGVALTYNSGALQGTTGPITPAATNSSFDIIQPTSYYNVYIKL